MRRLRNGLFAILLPLLSVLGGCADSTSSQSSGGATKCATLAACGQLAHKAGISIPITEQNANGFRFSVGYFYPGTTNNSSWSLRLQFKDLSANSTVEEDISPFGGFTCVPIVGVESAVTTPMGRSVCYLSAGDKSEARYGVGGLLYKLYILTPVSAVDLANVQTILEGAVDQLR